jgi:hypothetical protein
MELASLLCSFPRAAIGGIVQHVLTAQGQQCGTELPLAAIAQYVPHMREVLIEGRGAVIRCAGKGRNNTLVKPTSGLPLGLGKFQARYLRIKESSELSPCFQSPEG